MRKAYKTDLADVQWEFIRPLLPPARVKNGCPPTDLREVVNTILYQTKTGATWDGSPHDLAPKSTAFDYHAAWSADGTWRRILDAVRRAVRRQAGRSEDPTAGALDSQSAKAAAGVGDEVGADGGEEVKGRKRHTLTDTLGLLLCAAVTAANVSGGRAAPRVLGRLSLPDRASVRVVFADSRHHEAVCEAWFAGHRGMRLEVVSRPPGVTGIVPIRRRWVVERAYGWLMTSRRCVRGDEKRVWSSEARVKVAAIGMMLRRLRCGAVSSRDNVVASGRMQLTPQATAA